MSEGMEAILRRVAAGELTPEEALTQLDGDKPLYGAPESTPAGPDDLPVTGIRLHTAYRSLELVSDPEVAQLHVTGEHWVRQEGGILVITTPGPLDEEDQPGDRGAAGRFSFRSLPKTIAWARAWKDHQLTVRFNPELGLDLDVTGTDVKLTGPVGSLRARLAASSLKGDRLRGPIDLEAVSSSVKIAGRPLGESRLVGESSSVRLNLPGDADLTIRARNRMSSLKLPGAGSNGFALESDQSETKVGNGENLLTIEAVMSSVTVSSNSWDTVPS